jgi:hypothetical protein
MRKIYLLLAILCLAATASRAQTAALNRFIDEHKATPGFTFAYLSQDLFEVVSHVNVEEKDWKQLHRLVRNLGSLRVLAGDNIAHGLELYREARALVPESEFDELITVRAEETNVRIWSKDENNVVTDLVLLVGSPEEFVLMCFAGELELSNVADLARLIDAADATDLARSAQAVAIDFQVSPNPNPGEFVVTYADEQDAPVMLTVADQNGRQVGQVRLAGLASERVELRELPAGLYWVQLKTRSGKVGVKQVQIVAR